LHVLDHRAHCCARLLNDLGLEPVLLSDNAEAIQRSDSQGDMLFVAVARDVSGCDLLIAAGGAVRAGIAWLVRGRKLCSRWNSVCPRLVRREFGIATGLARVRPRSVDVIFCSQVACIESDGVSYILSPIASTAGSDGDDIKGEVGQDGNCQGRPDEESRSSESVRKGSEGRVGLGFKQSSLRNFRQEIS
jgi:hypothetical protein